MLITTGINGTNSSTNTQYTKEFTIAQDRISEFENIDGRLEPWVLTSDTQAITASYWVYQDTSSSHKHK